MANKHKSSRLWKAAFALCLVVFVASGGLLLHNLGRAADERAANEITRAEWQAVLNEGSAQGSKAAPQQAAQAVAAMQAENPDFFGWVTVDGTAIDYPVMFTPEEPEYYLRRAYDGSYAVSGTPFLSGDWFDGSGNFIVYGHHMDDGSMFADLLNYTDQDYRDAHPSVRFYTPTEGAEYTIFAAFYASGEPGEGDFAYAAYSDLTDPARFDDYIAHIQAIALYDTGIWPSYGQQLLTLSTCSDLAGNGRFVVVAVKNETP